MQKVDTKTIRDAINAYIREENLGSGIIRLRVFDAWDNAVGLNTAKITYDKFFKDGKFFCRIGSSLVRSQLSIIKEELRATMNKELKKEYVKEIILK